MTRNKGWPDSFIKQPTDDLKEFYRIYNSDSGPLTDEDMKIPVLESDNELYKKAGDALAPSPKRRNNSFYGAFVPEIDARFNERQLSMADRDLRARLLYDQVSIGDRDLRSRLLYDQMLGRAPIYDYSDELRKIVGAMKKIQLDHKPAFIMIDSVSSALPAFLRTSRTLLSMAIETPVLLDSYLTKTSSDEPIENPGIKKQKALSVIDIEQHKLRLQVLKNAMFENMEIFKYLGRKNGKSRSVAFSLHYLFDLCIELAEITSNYQPSQNIFTRKIKAVNPNTILNHSS